MAQRFISGGENQDEAGFSAIGDENLGAVENIAVIFEGGGGLHCGGVAARARFRKRESAKHLTTGDRRYEALFLLFITVHIDWFGNQAGASQENSGGGSTGATDFLDNEAELGGAAAAAAVLLGKTDSEESEPRHLRNAFRRESGLLIDLSGNWLQFLGGEIGDHCLEHLLLFSQGKIHLCLLTKSIAGDF